MKISELSISVTFSLGAITKPRILELMCRYVYYGIEDFLCHNTGIIKEIHLVSFNEATYQAFLKVFLDFSADEFRNSRECPPTKRPLSASMREKKEKWQACAPAAIWKMEEQNQSDTDLKNHVRKPLPNADDDNCIICLNTFENPIEFKKCHHAFCQDCIGEFFSLKPVCPICNTVYGKIYGDQPKTGTATIYKEQTPLPGEKCRETWVIFYDFLDGCQEVGSSVLIKIQSVFLKVLSKIFYFQCFFYISYVYEIHMHTSVRMWAIIKGTVLSRLM